ncbi:MAG: photosystem II stability/assembly factor-like uncharacterized protein [Rhodothermales bacterium]|jgi:photosystem II stability/assembly factor-like uncharacterized protein
MRRILPAAITLFVGMLLTLDAAAQIDPALYENLEYRSVGPNRGGRSAAVTGVPGHPDLYYQGATGGGVWRTTDSGGSWENISDGYFGSSIGAVAVSEWDNNVIYVGGGEVTVRGNVSYGTGMWKSEDAGKTWASIGLTDSERIPRIQIHPKNPDLVYAAVLGHLHGPDENRGVYRSKDGGATWDRILYVNDQAGAVDLVMDPSNPRVLYASTWRLSRTPYGLNSGGEGSHIWKSTDGGDTWAQLTDQDNGLPGGIIGISGITVSPANPDRVWAIIEHEDGGVFRSDDGGESWSKINSDRSLRQRAWYYTRIYADTKDEDVVYVLNVQFHKSTDGGATYERIRTPHGDHHDMWINPNEPNRFIVADDGGAQVTVNGGESFSTMDNQPTAQFYRVTTDNNFPYRILAAQQDNSTVRILHTSSGSEDDWTSTAGGESGWIAADPNNPDIVYGGSYGGSLTRVDHKTGSQRNVNVWPDNPMGHGAEDYLYRFQWNFPIVWSRHDANAVYAAANVLFKTKTDGQSWEAISPDLTRADPSTLKSSGGPITQDNTAVEYYATIFTMAEGEEEGVIWTGSDDGLIHITRDGGTNWTNITPPERIFPEWMMVNDIVVDPYNAGGAYVAGTRYKMDDFAPYLYKTSDYGATWSKITAGIPATHFTRTIEPDPERQGLLYAGTEFGMYISFDDGATWQSFQLNLPIVPITDLTWRDNDLVVATQGRALWILEDLMPLHHASADMAASPFTLIGPYVTHRMITGGGRGGGGNGVNFRYYLNGHEDDTEVTLRILETDGDIIKSYSSKDRGDSALSTEPGLNSHSWDMRYEEAEDFPGMILWSGGGMNGPMAVPGSYRARLIVGEDSTEVGFTILADPRSTSTAADRQAQFDFLTEVRDKLTETHQAIKRIRAAREQIDGVLARVPEDHAERDTLKASAKSLLDQMKEVEEALYQTKNRSGQDPLNFPIRLNNKLAAAGGNAAGGDYRPTEQAVAVRDLLVKDINIELAKLGALMGAELDAFNAAVRAANIPAVVLEN